MKHRTGYLLKRGDNFYVQWRVNGKAFLRALRDEQGQPITNKREAEEAKTKWMAQFTVATEVEALQALTGRLQGRKSELAKIEDELNPPTTINDAWSAYLESANRPDTGPDTLAVYQGQFGQFVTWVIEKHPEAPALRDINHDIAEEYAGELNHGRLSPNTFNKHIRVLELVFRVLKRKARISENPWENIQRKKLETSSRRELNVEELKRVCQSAKGEFRTLFGLGVYSGLRLKDCATLRWNEVDLMRGIIRRVPSKTARRNPRPVIVPIHPVLRSVIEQIPRHKRKDFVLPETAQAYAAGGTGKKRIIDSIQDHFVSQEVQIYKQGTGPGTGRRAVVEVGFHSLRHTFVSLCRESNAPLAVVESIVGHSNPAMTRHYTHVGEAAAGRAVAALPSIIGETVSPSGPAGQQPRDIIVKLRAILEKMTGKNWKAANGKANALISELERAIAQAPECPTMTNSNPRLLAN